MDGLRLALIIAGVALVAAVYWFTARRRRMERDAGDFERFDAWTDDSLDPLVDDGSVTQPNPRANAGAPAAERDEPEPEREPEPEPEQAPDLPEPEAPAAEASEPEAEPSPEPGSESEPEPEPETEPDPEPAEPLLSEAPVPEEADDDASAQAVPGPEVLEGLEAIAESLDTRREPSLGTMDEVAAKGEPPPRERAPAPSPGGEAPAPELVVVLNVLARTGEAFQGEALKAALEDAGLRPGDMQLYHYRAEAQPADAPPIFSALNAVKPGTLVPEELAGLTTPGIALVMQLPGVERPSEAFELMHSAAGSIAGALDGRLCDETRSTLTRQALNHLREKIAEYVRKRHVTG